MRNKFFAFIMAAAVTFSFTGCELSEIENVLGNKDDSSESENSSDDKDNSLSKFSDEYSPVSIDDVIEHVEEIIEDSEVSGNSEKLEKGIATLLNDLDSASEALSYITLDYYQDWYNTDLEAEYDSCYETYWLTYELLAYAFANCYVKDEYAPLFESYILDKESIEYFTDSSMSIRRLIGYAKVDYDLMDEQLDEYYDIAYNTSYNDNIKNNSSANVYMDILSTYDTETFYDNYNRDFTADEIITLSKVVKEELLPVMKSIEDSLEDIPHYDDVYDDPVMFDNPFETISEYAEKLSPEIAGSAYNLVDNSLYMMTSGDDCYNGSFTIDLPLRNSGLIYTYQYGDYYDLPTAIHEFGHFHAGRFDTTPTYLMANNIDISEIQSQGMEMIFMPLYDDIYGEQADAMRMIKLYDMLDSVISGFIIGEFEYTVLKNLDTMTAEDIVETFSSFMEDYASDYNFYYISHIFEQPGYYISYGVSALAAFDIWEESLSDNAKAVKMYESLAQLSSNSKAYQFKSTLNYCGFDNVLTEEYIRELAVKLQEYADSLVN